MNATLGTKMLLPRGEGEYLTGDEGRKPERMGGSVTG